MRISKDDPILIIGAGMSGLLTAAILHKHEFTQVRIFEQEKDLGTQKVPMQLTPAAMVALEEAGVLAAVLSEGMNWQQAAWQTLGGSALRSFDGVTMQSQHEMTPKLISKPLLYQRLKDQLPAHWIQTGKEFISFTQSDKSVEAHFQGNHSENGALLIGADGMQSRVRLQLMGDREKKEFGLLEIRALVDRNVLSEPEHPFLSSPWTEVLGQGQAATALSVSQQQAGMMLYVPPPAQMPADPQAVKRWLIEMYGSWPAVRGAIEQAWPADFAIQSLEERPLAKGWGRTRVALVGDAIHQAMPFLGFQDSLALVGAASLGKQLVDNLKKVERGLQRYEKARYKPTVRYQKLARRHAKMARLANPLSFRLRNLLYPSLPIGIREKAFNRLLGEA
ncbi:MAG: NAD(P)/FAD-dependent oxidoreductase [Bacteroidota bacterium]